MSARPLVEGARGAEESRFYVELGDPLVSYTQNFIPGLTWIALGTLGLIIVWPVFERTNMPGMVVLLTLVFLASLLALANGASLVWSHLKSTSYRICPRGIVMLPWGKVIGFRWQEIADLGFIRTTSRQGSWTVAGGESLSAVIRLQDHSRFVLKWLASPQIAFIESETVRAILPRVQEGLRSGNPVIFGEVAMSAAGLVHKKTLIPWGEIEKLEFRSTLVLTRKDGSRLYFFEVPNLGLFMALVNARLSTGRFDLEIG